MVVTFMLRMAIPGGKELTPDDKLRLKGTLDELLASAPGEGNGSSPSRARQQWVSVQRRLAGVAVLDRAG